MEVARRVSSESVLSRCSSRGRSRMWADDVQKTWTQAVPVAESFEHRLDRYIAYFELTDEQLLGVHQSFCNELEQSCTNRTVEGSSTSLKMLDSHITSLPTGNERGNCYALDFQGTSVKALRCRLEGNGHVSTAEHRVNLRDDKVPFPKGLLDKNCGAMALFNSLANSVKEIVEKSGDLGKSKNVPVGFSICFPCVINNLQSATLLELTKNFETGRNTADPVEGLDVVTLLDMAFWRTKVNAKTACIANDAVATLLACAYEKPARLPPCTVALRVGAGMNAAYVEPKWTQYGFKGCIINTELGGFDKFLPTTDVDLEVDFAEEGNINKQQLEKMVAGGYLGEICRRLVVKVWQADAPRLAWSRQALPTAAAALIVSDSSDDLELVNRLLIGLWDWHTDLPRRQIVQKLFGLVFERAAGLTAAVIAGLAKKCGRLQPAMGGVTVAIDGSWHVSHPWYCEKIRSYLINLLGEETASFINLYVANETAGKGIAVLAALQQE